MNIFELIGKAVAVIMIGTVAGIIFGMTVTSFNGASAQEPAKELGPATDPWLKDSTCGPERRYYAHNYVAYQGGLCDPEEWAAKVAQVNARHKFLQEKFGNRYRPSSFPLSEQYVDEFGITVGYPSPCGPWTGVEGALVFGGATCDPVGVSYSGLYAGEGTEGSALNAAALSFNGPSSVIGNPRSAVDTNPKSPCFNQQSHLCVIPK